MCERGLADQPERFLARHELGSFGVVLDFISGPSPIPSGRFADAQGDAAEENDLGEVGRDVEIGSRPACRPSYMLNHSCMWPGERGIVCGTSSEDFVLMPSVYSSLPFYANEEPAP